MESQIDTGCISTVDQATIRLMNLKSQLKYYLELRHITAAELSRRAGVSKQVISLWLSGSKPKNIEQVKKVATALETSVDQLVFGNRNGDEKGKITDIDTLLGDNWITGLFEVRMRRIKK